MTAHDPRVTLTEVLAGHVRLPMMHSQGCTCGWHASLSHPDLHRAHLAERLEEHFAARLAPIRAILDAWEAWDGSPGPDGGTHPDSSSPRDRDRLRAALDASSAPVSASQDHDGAEGQGEGLRTPQEWCDLLGARIADPDGWRDGTRDWSEPITREEFDRRLLRCTIDGRGYPDFLRPDTKLPGGPR